MGSSVTAVRSESFEADKRAVEGVRQKESEKIVMYRALHPKSEVKRLYLLRAKGNLCLISCERCIRNEEKSIGRYVKNWAVGRLLEQGLRRGGVGRGLGSGFPFH